jgi:hypothetical protein
MKTQKNGKTQDATRRRGAAHCSAARTNNKRINEFLADYDRRISDTNKTTAEAIKENLRRMRSAILLLAQNEPEKCELFINRWIAANLPPNGKS